MILGYSNLAVNLFIAGISLGPEKALMPEFVPMDIATAKSFLAQHHYGVLATRRKDGSPQMSPITPGLDDDGRVIISSRETAFKVKNLRRDPHASLFVFTAGFHGGGCVQINGVVEVISLPKRWLRWFICNAKSTENTRAGPSSTNGWSGSAASLFAFQ